MKPVGSFRYSLGWVEDFMMIADADAAAKTIEQFEGFSPTAYWDVNHYRIGFGSDTRTAGQIPVQPHDHTTREEALANLAARMPAFEHRIISQVGLDHWQKLPSQAQSALLSMCYNYGRLPSSVAHAVIFGNLFEVAHAVFNRRMDNGGVNRVRRMKEAELIRAAHGAVA